MEWFCNCGEPIEGDVVVAPSLDRAMMVFKSLKWENFKNSVWNQFLSLSFDAVSEEESDRISDEITDAIYDLFENGNRMLFRNLKNDPALIQAVRTDLMGAVFEEEYSGHFRPLFFKPLLLPWYRRGHLPCGWKGLMIDNDWHGNGPEDIPRGKLVVF